MPAQTSIPKLVRGTPLGKEAAVIADDPAMMLAFIGIEDNVVTVQFSDTGVRIRVQFSERDAFPKSEGMAYFEAPQLQLCHEVPENVLRHATAMTDRMQPFGACTLTRILQDLGSQSRRFVADAQRREDAAAAAAAAAVAAAACPDGAQNGGCGDDEGEWPEDYDEDGNPYAMEQYDSQMYVPESTGEFTEDNVLQNDMTQARASGLGVETEVTAGTQTITISIPVARFQLAPSTMSAWDVLPDHPIVVQLRFGSLGYTAATMRPDVSVTQNGNEWRLGQQLKQMLQTLFEHCWSASGFDDKRIDDHQQDTAPKASSFITTDAVGKARRVYVPYNTFRGFLAYVAEFLTTRAPAAHHFCVICDKPHVLENAMLQPSVCERLLCVYRFQTLRIGADAAERIATGGGVLDLLVAMFRHAALSPRADLILNPYPTLADPKNPSGAPLFGTDGAKKLELLVREVKRLPWVSDMIGTEGSGAKGELADHILRWVQTSNRSHIRKLPTNGLWSRMKTPHQFLFLSAAPERQSKFNALKREKGSHFAWHGSRIENWHSIMRLGLRNASGTTLQVNGAAHGNGIYLAPESSTSLGYSQGGLVLEQKKAQVTSGDAGYFDGAGAILCLALCEVIKGSETNHGWAWTVKEEDAVMTRFLFVFTSQEQSQGSHGVNVTDAAVMAEVRKFIDANA